MIVIDASAAIDLVLGTDPGRRIADLLAGPETSLHAPHLLDLEVAQVMRRYVHRGVMSPERAALAVSDFGQLDVARYAHEPLLPRIWELRDAMTAYDAAYVALAEVLGATLLTRDSKLASARGHRARVDLVR